MPSTIRETLSERIRAMPGLERFLADFRLATGLPAHFVSALGQRTFGPDVCTLCRYVHAHPQGARLCTRFLQQLLETATEHPASARCDAGLYEAAVPLRMGGQTFGYVVFGHCAARTPTRADRNEARHLLTRAGVPIDAAQLEVLATDVPIVSLDRIAALERIAADLVERLVLEITQHIVHPPASMPPLVERACHLVRTEYARPVALSHFAKKLGVSAGHLSRIFHHSTGLRFVEYVARVRADHARSLLRTTDRPVTDIAFACGFQSLSQFNRTIRAQFGCTPSALRQQAG
ncbi:MAG: helix-turn-helix domain-containing protein [Opitutaceae bacterium]|nr:helix-turn-helix domain-containing protein [Opitutaceae bacterium]